MIIKQNINYFLRPLTQCYWQLTVDPLALVQRPSEAPISPTIYLTSHLYIYKVSTSCWWTLSISLRLILNLNRSCLGLPWAGSDNISVFPRALVGDKTFNSFSFTKNIKLLLPRISLIMIMAVDMFEFHSIRRTMQVEMFKLTTTLWVSHYFYY